MGMEDVLSQPGLRDCHQAVLDLYQLSAEWKWSGSNPTSGRIWRPKATCCGDRNLNAAYGGGVETVDWLLEPRHAPKWSRV